MNSDVKCKQGSDVDKKAFMELEDQIFNQSS